MTQHELSQLVRDHVSSDEPPLAGPDEIIGHGRRRVRRRRFAAGGAGVLVAVVAMGGVLLVGPGDRAGDSDGTSIAPATQEALADYDAAAMPELLDRRARAVLSRSVEGLGESQFSASDANGAHLPPQHYDKASGMSATFDLGGAHRLAVDLSHSRGEAEGDAQEYCAEGLSDGSYLECTVEVVDGNVVIDKLWALRPSGVPHGASAPDMMMVTREDQLESLDPDKLFFERSVKVIKSETFLTYVSERVKAPTQEAAERLFEVPVADLVDIGVDPVLVMPAPPAGENGCPAWMLHNQNITCEG